MNSQSWNNVSKISSTLKGNKKQREKVIQRYTNKENFLIEKVIDMNKGTFHRFLWNWLFDLLSNYKWKVHHKNIFKPVRCDFKNKV